jgi:hypothetical protein
MIKQTRQIETPLGIEPVDERDRRVVQNPKPEQLPGQKARIYKVGRDNYTGG